MRKILPLAFLVYAVICLPHKLTAQLINTMAGKGIVGFSGDGGQATAATTNEPEGVTVDPAGNVYFADESNNRIRKVTTAGIISTIVGNGVAAAAGDGGQATAGSINGPDGLRFDHLGNLFIADNGNERVRKVNTSGVITTFAGTGAGGFSGDGGPANAAALNFPSDVASDATNNIYIADYFNNRIRKVNTSGIITTFAGNGVGGFSGNGGQATAAELSGPYGVRVDAANNVYIAEYTNHRIRIVNTSGVINTYAGTGVPGFSGDGGQATAAQLNGPVAITFDNAGNSYIADYSNNRIRKVTAAGVITTYAGNGVASYCCDGGPATAGEMAEPIDVEMNKTTGCLYEADWINERVRIICGAPLPITLLSFDAEYQQVNNTVALNWATATETDNKFFTIEKQTGGDNWQAVVNVDGAGNSSQTLYYKAMDENPYPGVSYYRLKQTDYDGNFTYSDVKTITVPEYNFVSIYPNPVRDNINLNYNSLNNGSVSIRIYSISGAEAMPANNNKDVQLGMNIISINTSELSSGMYILAVTNDVHTYYKKFIKQ
jgi:hypothetical protein